MKRLHLAAAAAFALLFFSSSPARALTLGTTRAEVRLRIKDASSLRYRYTDAQLNNIINEAQRDTVNAAWPLTKSTTFAFLINTTYYALPSDLIAIQRVQRDKILIPEVTLDKMDSDLNGGAWEKSSGTPRYYFWDMSVSPHSIGFYPYPNLSSGTATVYYYARATDLSADSDTPFNGALYCVPYHDLLIFYAAYRVYLMEGEADKAALYRQEYENRLQMMRGRVGSKPNYNPGFSGGKSP